jgi:stage II sporulation protein AA (anti-sigma F factor antagonist)
VRPDVVQVSASGEIDAGTDQLARALDDAVSGGAQHVVVDLLDVTFIDSSVVRSLVLAHRELSAREGWVRVVYTHHLIKRVIDICGLAEIFPQYPTVSAAMNRSPQQSDGVTVGRKGGA